MRFKSRRKLGGYTDIWISDAVWSGYFGIFYRKFFWDFVTGILRDPGGMQYVLKTNLALDKVFTNHPSELPRALLSSLPS